MTETTHPATDAQSPTDPAFDAIADSDTLATALDALAVLVDECVVRVEPDGLAVDAMDPATVGMVSLSLGADAFDAYDAPDAGLRLGIPLDRLRDVVGIADAGQPVRLAFDAESRMLHVRVGELAYTLACIDPDAVRSPPDRIDLAEQYTASATLDGAGFARAVDAADMVADHLALGTDADALYVRADGDTDSVEVDFPGEDCAAIDPGPAHSLFSLQYLASVADALPSDRDVDLRFGEEAPIEAGFDIAEGDGHVTFVVSPRMTVN
ncbi:DNA polymerase sliding clamp [Halobacterium litoreum]|uniref:DNA polymerase sliding clamp n=1 Tax=Halobacterium litoreum TaxID=2039234 RepID=A0ABD5NEN6_9EURY|nr:DNA polymerase sliding clamp [Halobacterium litoreum]UHH13527.1 DNA polymerase sliding clamp [Halobacterium litoreum]